MKEHAIIEVKGGIAEVRTCPDNVEVTIIDWDNCPVCGTQNPECSMCHGLHNTGWKCPHGYYEMSRCPTCGGSNGN